MILIVTFVGENLVCENLNWNYWAINSLRTVYYALKVAITFLLILLFDECLLHKDDIFKIMAKTKSSIINSTVAYCSSSRFPSLSRTGGQLGDRMQLKRWFVERILALTRGISTDFYIKYGRLLFNLLRSIIVGINFALPLSSCCQNLFCTANLSVI